MQVLTRPSVRSVRWVAVGLTGVILAGAGLPAAHASDQPVGLDDPTPASNIVLRLPPPCDKLALRSVGPCPPPVSTSTVRCRDWMVGKLGTQGGRDRLVVSAMCTVRAGERVELRRHEPQGINPADLLVELVVHRGPFPDVPVPFEVRVVHVEPDAGYNSVTVLPDGPTLPVKEVG